MYGQGEKILSAAVSYDKIVVRRRFFPVEARDYFSRAAFL